MDAADLAVLLLESLQAPHQWVCDGEVFVILVVASVLGVIERRLHLTDDSDDLLCLVDHLLLLLCYETNLAVERFGESGEELQDATMVSDKSPVGTS
jgi:hypothetical protein